METPLDYTPPAPDTPFAGSVDSIDSSSFVAGSANVEPAVLETVTVTGDPSSEEIPWIPIVVILLVAIGAVFYLRSRGN